MSMKRAKDIEIENKVNDLKYWEEPEEEEDTLMYGFCVGFEVIDAYDIAIIFKPGTPRDIEDIMADARQELEEWTQAKVHKQYFTYTLGKLTGQRPAALRK